MPSNSSRALITDFDGTLVRLAVDWTALRARLGVDSIASVIASGDAYGMDVVRDAEVEGARHGGAIERAVSFAEGFARLVVLTNNSEAAVRAFLDRAPRLAERCAAVLGRETHGQRKQDPAVFAELVRRAASLLGLPPHSLSYLGDEPYELAAAHALGLSAIDVAALPRSDADPGPVSDL